MPCARSRVREHLLQRERLLRFADAVDTLRPKALIDDQASEIAQRSMRMEEHFVRHQPNVWRSPAELLLVAALIAALVEVLALLLLASLSPPGLLVAAGCRDVLMRGDRQRDA